MHDQLTEEEFSRLPADVRIAIEELVATESAILQASKSGFIDSYVPLPHQLQFHELQEQNRWMLCANRVGKSTAIAQEVRWFALGDHPYREVEPRGEIWCCCPSFEKSKMHQQPLIEAAIGQGNIRAKYEGDIPRFELQNGVVILFKTYEQKPMKFESSEVRLVAFDEEPTWPIFEGVWFRRGAGMKLDIVGGATMIQGLTWLYDKVVQMNLPSTAFVRARLDDNPFILAEERQMLKDGVTGIMRRIRVDGEILAVGGSMRFDADQLDRMMKRKAEPKLIAYRANGRWVSDEMGPLTLYELPIEGSEYVIGGDIAEGLNTNYTDVEPEWDQTSLQIMRRNTRTIIGDYTVGNEEPGYIGEEVLPALSDWFMRARCNIELNNHGHTVVWAASKKIKNRLHSPMPDRTARRKRISRKRGYETTVKSRSYAIDMLASELEQSGPRRPKAPDGTRLPVGIELLNPATIRQHMTFIRKPNGRIEHQDGCKDDRVIAVALAVVCDKDLPAVKVYRPMSDAEALRRDAYRNVNGSNLRIADLEISRYRRL